MPINTHVGYFEDLGRDGALLIEADADGLKELIAIFEALASGRLKKVMIHGLPTVQAHGHVELRAILGPQDGGVRKGAGKAFLWERSSDGWREAAAKLAALLSAGGSGHQYLEAQRDDVVPIVSKGEYGEKWWMDFDR